jgi:hypothetical protein
MKRLKDISLSQLEEWKKTRARIGRQKYQDKHLKRYNLVDVMEEILDAENIIELFEEKAITEATEWVPYYPYLDEIKGMLREIAMDLCILDIGVSEQLCTDEEGGDRIWWND